MSCFLSGMEYREKRKGHGSKSGMTRNVEENVKEGRKLEGG
jgi:hypothetical protein